MATFQKFDSFVAAVANGAHKLGTDQIMVALTNTPPVAGNTILANIAEISYTNLSSRIVTLTSSAQLNGLYKLILADLVLTASGAVGPFRYVVLYNNSATNKELIAWADYASSISLAAGETFTLDFDNVQGVIQIQ